jgi:hypothetical protein
MERLIVLQDGKEMERILKLLLSRNIQVSSQIIHIMLKYYAVNGPLESAENLFDYCKTSGLTLGQECYQELIDAYANFNLPWKSLHVLQMMEVEGMPKSLTVLYFYRKNNIIFL